MDWLIGADWRKMFVPDTAILEIVIRGTVMYLALYFLLRLIHKRQTGGIGITDLLVIVLIADAAGNAMGADYRSLPNGIILVATIIFWSFALDWLGYQIPALQPLIYPRAIQLIKDGQMRSRNMQRESMTDDELMSQLRLQGVDDIEDVKDAHLEGDGRLSVIVKTGRSKGAPEKPIS